MEGSAAPTSLDNEKNKVNAKGLGSDSTRRRPRLKVGAGRKLQVLEILETGNSGTKKGRENGVLEARGGGRNSNEGRLDKGRNSSQSEKSGNWKNNSEK